MPAPPEILNALRRIRITEVDRDFKAKHPPQPTRHIRITGKIKVDLQRESSSTRPGPQNADITCQCAQALPQFAHRIRQKHFFTQTDHQQAEAVSDFVPCLLPVTQLGAQLIITHNRARDQLRKKRHIGGKTNQTVFRRHGIAVDIHHIGHYLKRVKRDAERQRDRAGQQLPQPNGFQDKARIFEYHQKPKVDHQRRDQPQPLTLPVRTASHLPSHPPVDNCGDQDDRQEPGLAPSVKQQVCRKQKRIAPAARKAIISHQRNRQEEIKKNQTGEAQSRTAFTDSANPAPRFWPWYCLPTRRIQRIHHSDPAPRSPAWALPPAYNPNSRRSNRL